MPDNYRRGRRKGTSGTFVRPPSGIAARLNDFFVPRKMEFKGWVTDYKRCSLEGLTNNEVTNSISDLQKMVPNEFHKHIGWDHTKTEQGNWADQDVRQDVVQERDQFGNVIGILEIAENELEKVLYKLHGQRVSARMEMSPKRKPLAKAHDLFYKGLKEVGGNGSKIHVVCWKCRQLQNTPPEGEGLVGGGWNIKYDVFAAICTDFCKALFFEAIGRVKLT